MRGKGSLVESHFCVCETNLIIWILVDGLFPATDNHDHAIPRRSTELIRANAATFKGKPTFAGPEWEYAPKTEGACATSMLCSSPVMRLMDVVRCISP